MPQRVVDLSSNAEENVANAAKVIGRSEQRRRVFDFIYTGKARVKTVKQIASATGLTEKRVLECGKVLSDSHVVEVRKQNGFTAYQKIDFYHRRKKEILGLAGNKKKLSEFPTKRNPSTARSSKVERIVLQLKVPKRNQRARLVTIDDIDSFSKARSTSSQSFVKMSETNFKKGVAAILGEKGVFKDWGGESRDLFSTHLRIGGRRRATAFAFKGPGQKGRLTPGKLGKNGDQIQRLARCPAEVFLIQYWAQIEDSVLEQLENFVKYRSYFEDREMYYGVIDGNDSARLIAAYPSKFGKSK